MKILLLLVTAFTVQVSYAACSGSLCNGNAETPCLSVVSPLVTSQDLLQSKALCKFARTKDMECLEFATNNFKVIAAGQAQSPFTQLMLHRYILDCLEGSIDAYRM